MASSKVKIIQPPIIEPTPLNGQEYQYDTSAKTTTSSTMNTTSTETTETRRLDPPQAVKEVISRRLDTVKGLIKSKLEFSQFGALKIGKEGETGTITIDGDGITAENVNGETTFNLDGRDGSATFSGELAANNILTGEINLGVDGRIYGGDGTNYRWVLGKLFS